MDTHEIISKVQLLLLTHPLFNRCVNHEHTICACVMGDTKYAEVFVDYALQTGQMLDKKLIIHWCISDDTVRAEYLAKRPALCEFIDTDGCLKEHGKDYYGSLVFHDAEDYFDHFGGECRYIFAATGDDAKNLETAEIFKQMVNTDCLAAYVNDNKIEVTYGFDPSIKEVEEAIDSVTLISSEQELERMAFNTHRIWAGSGNLDYDELQAGYNTPYNHDSSIAFALSIPYKLRSVGIYETDPCKAAALLMEVLNKAKQNPESKEAGLLAKLGALEHRRWVLEKVAQGATGFVSEGSGPNYLSCVKCGKIKEQDEHGNLHRHPCIARSDGNSSLAGYGYDKKKWDNPAAEDKRLDDLDLMSVQMHRVMANSAKGVYSKRSELEHDLDMLEKDFENEALSTREMVSRYIFCIKNILDHSVPYSAQYGTYKSMLLKKVNKLENAAKKLRAKEEVDRISKLLFPVIESNLYRDYKQYDVELMTHIPFILTGHINVELCMPLGPAIANKNNNDEFFRSVASATALYADKITYLFVPEYNTDAGVFFSKLKAIHSYFESRNKDCDVFVQILQPEGYNYKIAKAIEKSLKEAKEERRYIKGYNIRQFSSADELVSLVKDVVEASEADYYDGTDMLLGSASVNGRIVQEVMQVIPYFEFESYNKKFVNCVDCDYLNYSRISTFIQVEDMFALMNAKDMEFNYRSYAKSYMKFWDIYSGKNIPDSKFAVCAACWSKVSEIIRENGYKEKISVTESEKQTLIAMLEELKAKNFITNLRYSSEERNQKDSTGEKKYSMTVRLKSIDSDLTELTKAAGELLEVYVYFKALETGWFDDIQTGYKFRWEGGRLINELDCVLTKDYRSLLVECKSVKKPDEDFFLILDSLGDHFGIGYKKVLIMVTDTDDPNYKIYEERGKLMDVLVFSTREELENIGLKLRKLMED